MGTGIRYSNEFKQEAVNQVVVHGYSVLDVAERLGVSNKSLYDWIKIFSKPKKQRDEDADLRTENARLKRELKRAQQESDILKEAVFFASESKSATRSLKSRSSDCSVRVLCSAMEVHPSGYYEWLHAPQSDREIEDHKLTAKIKQNWIESGGHSGCHNLHLDLVEAGIACGRDRALRLMRQVNIRAVRGYRKPKDIYGGRPHLVAPNVLDREFDVDQPNQWWVSDITYIHTHEGFLFLSVVMDLYARNIVG